MFGAAHDGGSATCASLLDRGSTRSVRVVVYLRRQDDHACSRYQQVVKRSGEIRRLAERVEEMDLSEVYDYHSRLVAWRDLMRPDELIVRRFERRPLPQRVALRDFVDAAGIGIDPRTSGPTRNESLDAESVEFLRLFKSYRRDAGTRPRPAARQRLISAGSNGPPTDRP